MDTKDISELKKSRMRRSKQAQDSELFQSKLNQEKE